MGNVIRVTGWSNGHANDSTGGGYGVCLSKQDREKYFKGLQKVSLDLGAPHGKIMIQLTPSFWENCPEFRRKEIGQWMLDRNLTPWEHGTPPKLKLEKLGRNQFRLSL